MEHTNIAFKVHDLTVAYNSNPVLWDIDMEIPTGSLACIVGPNGAGKTTLIKTALGLIKPVTGHVHFPSLEVNTTDIAYVPQSSSVDWDFPASVLDIVLMGRYGHLGLFKRPKENDKKIALNALKLVGMQDYSSRQINKLSGGQKQRVFLARALAQEAKIYFLDEPFKGVDVKTEKAIIEILKDLKSKGKTVIVVHHNLSTVKEYFDWVTLVNLRIIKNGLTSDVFTDENIQKTFGERKLFEERTLYK
ncbi:MAG: metal ABC transporter ATP-binding protein [Clostridia bacterium]